MMLWAGQGAPVGDRSLAQPHCAGGSGARSLACAGTPPLAACRLTHFDEAGS